MLRHVTHRVWCRFLFAMFLTLAYWTFYGQQNVHITPAIQLSNALSAMSFGLINVLCGFLKPQPQIPAGYIWAYWINPMSWVLHWINAFTVFDIVMVWFWRNHDVIICGYQKHDFQVHIVQSGRQSIRQRWFTFGNSLRHGYNSQWICTRLFRL